MALKIDFISSAVNKLKQAFTDGANESNGLKEGGIVYDTQISGVQDDGSPEGIIKAKIVSGELVAVNIRDIPYFTTLQGSATATPSPVVFNNPDSTQRSLNLNVPSGLGVNSVVISFTVYGTSVILRFRRNSSTPPFSVELDAQPFDCPAEIQNNYFLNEVNSLTTEAVWVVAENMSNIAHTVKIIIQPDTSISRQLIFHGILGEKKSGYKLTTPSDFFFSPGIVPATNTSLLTTSGSTNFAAGIKAILYKNIDTVARKVTISYNSIDYYTVYLAAKDSQGDSSVLYLTNAGINPGDFNVPATNVRHRADAASVVNYIYLGGL